MGVSHVFRGEEWISSLPKHNFIYKAFNWQPPIYLHLPLIIGQDKQKLSKRHGDTSVQEFIKKGILPEALVNYIALLGWHPKDDQEIFSLSELVDKFNINDVQKSAATFSLEKLEWFNSKYLKSLNEQELEKYLEPIIKSNFKDTEIEQVKRAIPLVKDRLANLEEFTQLVSFAKDEIIYQKDLLPFKTASPEETRLALEFSTEVLNEYSGEFTETELEKYFHENIKKAGKKNGLILWPLRVALTGKKASPGTFEVMAMLGRDISIARVKQAIAKLE